MQNFANINEIHEIKFLRKAYKYFNFAKIA
jgi:hypothetical protein